MLVPVLLRKLKIYLDNRYAQFELDNYSVCTLMCCYSYRIQQYSKVFCNPES